MTRTGGNFVTETLEQYGVTHLFGNPGTTELPIMNAVGDSDLEYVLALHEDIAVGAAAGYAKTLDSYDDPEALPVGVANLHIAPGVAHGLGNVFDSSLVGTGAPIVVTAGTHPMDHQHREPNLGGDVVEMTKQFTKWSAEVKHVDSLPTMLRRAFRVAMTPPTGPVFLALPFDVMTAETDAEPEPLGYVPRDGPGDSAAVDRAAEAIADAEEPVLVTGDLLARSGPDAVSAAVEFAETVGAPVYGELKASEISFPPDHELWHGRLPRDQDRVAEILSTDTLVMAGAVSNTTTNPQERQLVGTDTTVVQISNHAWEVGKNVPAAVGVLGDPGTVLEQLGEELRGRIPEETVDARLASAVRPPSTVGETPENLEIENDVATNDDLAAAMYAAAPDARIVAEAPTSTGAVRRRYDFDPGQYFANRGGGLGYGLPAAVGSAIAESTRENPRATIGFVGDGSYLYYPETIYTAARYEVDLTVVVPDNRNYRILKDNTLRIFGGEEDDYEFVGMDFEPPVDIPGNAETHGARGRFIEDPSEIEGAVAEAVSESGPTVLDVRIQD